MSIKSDVTLSDHCEIASTEGGATTCLSFEQHSPVNNHSESLIKEPGSPKSVAALDVSSASNQKGSLPSEIFAAIETGKSGLKSTQPNDNQSAKSPSISLQAQKILDRRRQIAGNEEDDERDSLLESSSNNTKVSTSPVKTHTQFPGGIPSLNASMLSKIPAQKTVDQLKLDLESAQKSLDSAITEENKALLELSVIKQKLESHPLTAQEKAEFSIKDNQAQKNQINAANKKANAQKNYDNINAEIEKREEQEGW